MPFEKPPKKPRMTIHLVNGVELWMCTNVIGPTNPRGWTGYGYNPEHAYRNWIESGKHYANFNELD